MALTTQQIEELEKVHGQVAHCKGKALDNGEPAWEIVLKKPMRKHYKVFRAMCNNDKQKADATEFMARQMVVYPSPEAFDQLLEQHFGICETGAVSKAIISLCDMESDDTGKL